MHYESHPTSRHLIHLSQAPSSHLNYLQLAPGPRLAAIQPVSWIFLQLVLGLLAVALLRGLHSMQLDLGLLSAIPTTRCATTSGHEVLLCQLAYLPLQLAQDLLAAI